MLFQVLKGVPVLRVIKMSEDLEAMGDKAVANSPTYRAESVHVLRCIGAGQARSLLTPFLLLPPPLTPLFQSTNSL